MYSSGKAVSSPFWPGSGSRSWPYLKLLHSQDLVLELRERGRSFKEKSSKFVKMGSEIDENLNLMDCERILWTGPVSFHLLDVPMKVTHSEE